MLKGITHEPKKIDFMGDAHYFCGIPNLTYAQSMQLTMADSIRLVLANSPVIKAVEAEIAKAS